MAAIEVRLLFEDFSVNDEAQVAALLDDFDASVSEICGSTVVTATCAVRDGQSRIAAAQRLVESLEHALSAKAVDVDLDLVDEGEIAQRLSKTRQAINLLANGDRGSSFPAPYSLPGGHRIWTWASIARWAAHYKTDWLDEDEPEHLTREEQRDLASWLVRRFGARYLRPVREQPPHAPLPPAHRVGR